MDDRKLMEFVVYAKLNSYANENVKYSLTSYNTKRIEISKEAFLFVDEYVGENPFSGVETVFYKNKPVWQMHYYGWVKGEDKDVIYTFLKAALRNVDKDRPIRGKSGFNRDG